jgi:hypothetical protein
MRLLLLAAPSIALVCGCASVPSTETLGTRLAALPAEWPPVAAIPENAVGTVVLRDGKRIAIRLDPAPAASKGPWTMGVYDETGYKAECKPLELYEGHVLGFLVVEMPDKVVRVGDRAAQKAP